VLASHCLARYVDTKEKILLLCTVALSFGLAFFEARGNLLAIYMSVLFCYFVKMRNKISLLRIAAATGAIIVVGFYLGSLRAGSHSMAGFFGSFMDTPGFIPPGTTFSGEGEPISP
jgi:hypothetical protein